ncbi:hypothetical protein [Segniliparus rugosus]|uniref:Uncharacterized protein n=1 Tax=Segniliparus rugosus (strain ATCC BAA-974 / DSM 45345 / CCUG 50838 / CIP 108380 / JCM 13579 / CDC 945) TaxID=679197 RepID=E5XU98_SEGRC|nr:hypothetical protein [Segniliparus rugosus]EFV12097.2 hypothetical protein HMPREF9336_03070 [Segniliparus rugosus ATCC BAA-974]
MTGPGLVPLEVRRGGMRLFVWWVNLTVAVVGVMIFGVRAGEALANARHGATGPLVPSFSWTRTTETVRVPPAEPGGPTTERTLVLPRRAEAPEPALRPQAAPRTEPLRHTPLRWLLSALLVASWSAMAVLYRRIPSRTRSLVLRWLRADWLLCGTMLLALGLQFSVAGFVATGSRQCAEFAVQFRGTLLVAMVMLLVLRLFFRPSDAAAAHGREGEAARLAADGGTGAGGRLHG